MAKSKKDSSKYRKGRTNNANDRFKDIDDPDAWAEKHYDQFLKDLPANERDGLVRYTGGSYTAMNKYLRGNTDYISDENRAAIEGATKAFEKSSVPEDVVAHRGFSKFGIFKDLSSLKEGTVYRDPGFTSTSVASGSSFGWSGDPNTVKVKVYVPKGTKAIYVDHVSQNRGEKELLIAPNSKFKIVKVDAANNRIEVRLLPPKNKSKETSTYEPKFKTK